MLPTFLFMTLLETGTPSTPIGTTTTLREIPETDFTSISLPPRTTDWLRWMVDTQGWGAGEIIEALERPWRWVREFEYFEALMRRKREARMTDSGKQIGDCEHGRRKDQCDVCYVPSLFDAAKAIHAHKDKVCIMAGGCVYEVDKAIYGTQDSTLLITGKLTHAPLSVLEAIRAP